jgi:hypothetical protein
MERPYVLQAGNGHIRHYTAAEGRCADGKNGYQWRGERG